MSPQVRIIRALVAILVMITALRLYSYLRERKRRGAREFFDFISIALLSPHLVYSPQRYDARPRQSVRQIIRIVVAIFLIGFACVGTDWLTSLQISRNSWLVNHLIIVVAFVVIMTAFGQMCYGKW